MAPSASLLAASRNMSGSGFPLSTSSPPTSASTCPSIPADSRNSRAILEGMDVATATFSPAPFILPSAGGTSGNALTSCACASR